MSNLTGHCSGCGQPEPDWPAGWITLDNGDRYCPPCRKNLYLLHSTWGLDLGDDTPDLTSDDVPEAPGTQRPDDPDEA